MGGNRAKKINIRRHDHDRDHDMIIMIIIICHHYQTTTGELTGRLSGAAGALRRRSDDRVGLGSSPGSAPRRRFALGRVVVGCGNGGGKGREQVSVNTAY
jgi:hypothetical protein